MNNMTSSDQAKSHQLRAIQMASECWRKGVYPPHQLHVIRSFFIGLILATFTSYFFGIVAYSFGFLVPFLMGFSMVRLAHFFSERPRTHSQNLDRLIAEYDPENKEAYRDLQMKTKLQDKLSWDLIDTWIELERQSIEISGEKNKPAVIGFLAKQV